VKEARGGTAPLAGLEVRDGGCEVECGSGAIGRVMLL